MLYLKPHVTIAITAINSGSPRYKPFRARFRAEVAQRQLGKKGPVSGIKRHMIKHESKHCYDWLVFKYIYIYIYMYVYIHMYMYMCLCDIHCCKYYLYGARVRAMDWLSILQVLFISYQTFSTWSLSEFHDNYTDLSKYCMSSSIHHYHHHHHTTYLQVPLVGDVLQDCPW